MGIVDFKDNVVEEVLELLTGKKAEMKEEMEAEENEDSKTAKNIKEIVVDKGINEGKLPKLIHHLVTWMKRLERHIKLPEGLEGDTWMEYFLESEHDMKDFCHVYRSSAPNGLYGMFRRPLTK